MPAPADQRPVDPIHAAYQDGRRLGLATAALALSIVAFINLLGIEKSILAIVLALLAMQGALPGAGVLRRGRIALVLAVVHWRQRRGIAGHLQRRAAAFGAPAPPIGLRGARQQRLRTAAGPFAWPGGRVRALDSA